MIEITDSDIQTLRTLMLRLDELAKVDGLETVLIHATIAGQKFVLGYGEAGEPAVLISEVDWAAMFRPQGR